MAALFNKRAVSKIEARESQCQLLVGQQASSTKRLQVAEVAGSAGCSWDGWSVHTPEPNK
eukprot:scaffold27295_cov50-Skeletonema_dohrnii-CCMP3373.AAC.1